MYNVMVLFGIKTHAYVVLCCIRDALQMLNGKNVETEECAKYNFWSINSNFNYVKNRWTVYARIENALLQQYLVNVGAMSAWSVVMCWILSNVYQQKLIILWVNNILRTFGIDWPCRNLLIILFYFVYLRHLSITTQVLRFLTESSNECLGESKQ